MENMARIFAESYVHPLVLKIQTIQTALSKIQAHWIQLNSFLDAPETASRATLYGARPSLVNSGGPQSGSDSMNHDESHIASIWPRNDSSKMGCSDGPPTSSNLAARRISILIQEMREERNKLHQQLNALNKTSIQLDRTIQTINLKALQIGPAFLDNPAQFIMGTPLVVLHQTALIAPSIENAVEQMEAMKQERSVAEGAQHFYRLLLRSMRALRNMEQGMANYLEKTVLPRLPKGVEEPKV